MTESERVTIALAERDAFRDALRDVMRLLRAVAGSPSERKVYEHARGLLAAAGVNAAEAAVYQAAYEQWEERVEARERPLTIVGTNLSCLHARCVWTCPDCWKALVGR